MNELLAKLRTLENNGASDDCIKRQLMLTDRALKLLRDNSELNQAAAIRAAYMAMDAAFQAAMNRAIRAGHERALHSSANWNT